MIAGQKISNEHSETHSTSQQIENNVQESMLLNQMQSTRRHDRWPQTIASQKSNRTVDNHNLCNQNSSTVRIAQSHFSNYVTQSIKLSYSIHKTKLILSRSIHSPKMVDYEYEYIKVNKTLRASLQESRRPQEHSDRSPICISISWSGREGVGVGV